MDTTYVYYYRADSSCEVIGRVNAIDLDNAIEQISILKHLSRDLIEELFVVKRIQGGDDENDF
jgi:hypothetical protein